MEPVAHIWAWLRKKQRGPEKNSGMVPSEKAQFWSEDFRPQTSGLESQGKITVVQLVGVLRARTVFLHPRLAPYLKARLS